MARFTNDGGDNTTILPDEEVVEQAGHNPGPWRFSESAHRNEWSHWIMANDLMVGAVSTFGFPDRENANARLIAAAPDLLAALRLLVSDVAGYEAWQRPCHALDVALAAIAKAEGAEVGANLVTDGSGSSVNTGGNPA